MSDKKEVRCTGCRSKIDKESTRCEECGTPNFYYPEEVDDELELISSPAMSRFKKGDRVRYSRTGAQANIKEILPNGKYKLIHNSGETGHFTWSDAKELMSKLETYLEGASDEL